MSKALRAHFDGKNVVLDEPCDLARGTAVIVTVAAENHSAETGGQPAEPQPKRWLALLMGAGYMLFVAQVLCQVTKWSFGAAFGVTVIGCLIVMTALALLGVKAYRKKDARNRFTFSTVFLASIPLSVYLAALRLLLRDTPPESLTIGHWLLLSVISVFAMIFSTVILLSFAESLVWLAVACLAWRRKDLPRHRLGQT